jgi:uncharacterized protein YidB (DUF937 family)
MLDKLLSQARQGMLGGQQQAANPMMQMLASMLGNGSQFGGLAGLLQQFQKAGLGDQAASWVSTGQNLPISPEQLMKVFGGDQMQQMASSVGLDTSAFGGQMSQMLPQVIDMMTPNGELPAAGADDPMAMLSKMFGR